MSCVKLVWRYLVFETTTYNQNIKYRPVRLLSASFSHLPPFFLVFVLLLFVQGAMSRVRKFTPRPCSTLIPLLGPVLERVQACGRRWWW